jgi:hypothetical protein
MKKLFYRLACSRSITKLFSMQARLEEKRRVMIPKSSVFAVVALASFMSLGTLLLPQVVQAQDCLFDCPDLGSDPSFNPWGNSPQALDIVYCFDRDCVLNLKDSKKKPIFTGNSIPTPQVSHTPDFSCPVNPGTSTGNVTISGQVVALLRDPKTGNLNPLSAAQATLTIVIKDVTCTVSPGGATTVSKVLTLDPNVPTGQPRTDVIEGSITILSPIPSAWGPSCPTNPTAQCAFPLGIVEFRNNRDLENHLPATTTFPKVGEVYRAVKSTRFVGIRDCKGDANGLPSTIACSAGAILTGGNAEGLFTFDGNWSGAGTKTINPKSGTGPFDIITPLFGSILPNTVTASANNGPEVPTTGCNDMPSQGVERCSFPARTLLPNGCTENEPVDILVRGKLDIGVGGTDFRFVSKDNPICNSK